MNSYPSNGIDHSTNTKDKVVIIPLTLIEHCKDFSKNAYNNFSYS
jgi:hypothetical protein